VNAVWSETRCDHRDGGPRFGGNNQGRVKFTSARWRKSWKRCTGVCPGLAAQGNLGNAPSRDGTLKLWQQTRRRGRWRGRVAALKTTNGTDSGLWVLGMGHGAGRGLLRRSG